MKKISVNLDEPSPYIEKSGFFYQFKRRLTYKFFLKKLRKINVNSPIESLLEIGTGSGYFLFFVKELFPAIKLYGIEYDQRLIDVAKKKVPNADLMQANAENCDYFHNQFDVIVSFQVIEHLYSPEKMLANIKKHLKPNGVLIITTPNLESISRKLMGPNWHAFRSDHVSLKSAVEWEGLIECCGFKKVYSGTTFFSGIPIMNKFPFGIINWILLLIFGALPWSYGESYVGIFTHES